MITVNPWLPPQSPIMIGMEKMGITIETKPVTDKFR